jgi:hypothetical protein
MAYRNLRTGFAALFLAFALSFAWPGPALAQDDPDPPEAQGPASEDPGPREAGQDTGPDGQSAGPEDPDAGDVAPGQEKTSADERAILDEALLDPAAMIEEPPLTENDFVIFMELYNYMLIAQGQLDFIAFARNHDVTLRRLNYMSAKISLPLGEPSRKGQLISEFGLGVLMDGQEKALFEKFRPQLEELSQAMKKSLLR